MPKNVVKVLFFVFAVFGYAQQSLAFDEKSNAIVLGVSNAQTGPAKQLGIRLNQGAKVYFNKVNLLGGINGQQVKLLIRDDGYEPFKMVGNVQMLLNEANLFGFFNFVGTPTTNAAMPMIKASKLPLLMPFTGAEFLRANDANDVYNLRASYYQEAQAQIKYLLKNPTLKKFGLLIQADEFGLAVEQGYINTMSEVGITPQVVTRYRRNTNDIALALEILKDNKVDVVLFVGTYKPMAELINRADSDNFTPYYSTVSFISSYELFSRIKTQKPVKVIVTEVMPDPNLCEVAICQQFIKDMNIAGYYDLDQIQLEGYLNAYVFTQAAKLCGKKLTSQCLLTELRKFPINFFNHHPAKAIGGNFTAPVYLNFYPN
ncbi:ABC transporter substrate-binding protein [Thalassotalea sp. PLHSN55]|uniref:ABC transporter substrate-binding protein n=1 Tax=Thalassotalea sp. PLHSN55 TaxID=3435888 RepID=UPI003F826BF2